MELSNKSHKVTGKKIIITGFGLRNVLRKSQKLRTLTHTFLREDQPVRVNLKKHMDLRHKFDSSDTSGIIGQRSISVEHNFGAKNLPIVLKSFTKPSRLSKIDSCFDDIVISKNIYFEFLQMFVSNC